MENSVVLVAFGSWRCVASRLWNFATMAPCNCGSILLIYVFVAQ